MALNENLRLYNAPEALAMGNAFAADVQGYISDFYNPAALAKSRKRRWEVTPIDVEGIPSLGSIALNLAAHSMGINRLASTMGRNPGKYNYFSFSGVPGFSTRGFGAAFLGTYQYAGVSDGTNLDVDASETFGTSMGIASNFFGNAVKFGVAGKLLLRNQLKGNFAISSLSGDTAVSSLMKEGWAYGADVGMLVTVPAKYLPAIGVVWRDALGTKFHASHVLNSHASGAPDTIPQAFDIAASLHPILSREWRATIALELSDCSTINTAQPLLRHTHFGLKFESEKSFYLWLGANQLYPGGGMGLRVKGGALEVGTYAEDVGMPGTDQSDRRVFFRYTIGF